MLRFEAGVEIHRFTYDLIPVFVNVSMWATRYSVGVSIIHIASPTELSTGAAALLVLVDLDVTSGRALDRAHLMRYLCKTMPADFVLTETADYIQVRRPVPARRSCASARG